MKATQSERKKMYREPTVTGNWDSNQRFGPEGRKKQSTITEWRNKNFLKNEERLRNLQDIFKCSNIRIIGVSEGKEEQEMENLFEKIMKKNFPNLAKEIDFQEVQGAQSPKEVEPKEHNKAHHNYISQD